MSNYEDPKWWSKFFQTKFTRRQVLEATRRGVVTISSTAILLDFLAACGSAEPQKLTESDLLGGEWIFPAENGQTIPEETILKASAYPALPNNGATVSFVLFTVNPADLKNPIFYTDPKNPLTAYQGSDVILGMARPNRDGIYALGVNFATYKPDLAKSHELSFNVYGKDKAGNSIRHEDPNGPHNVNFS